ncbi:MAG TPA: hypothetical protein VK437_13440 [Steroidobacteraceae bacterium]|nr:hypothetical protein [Steroidobacteraceae bacterium]
MPSTGRCLCGAGDLVALADGSPGTGIAELNYLPADATDLFGRSMVQNGLADIGAIARV